MFAGFSTQFSLSGKDTEIKFYNHEKPISYHLATLISVELAYLFSSVQAVYTM